MTRARYFLTLQIPELGGETDDLLVLMRDRTYLVRRSPNFFGAEDTVMVRLRIPETGLLEVLDRYAETLEPCAGAPSLPTICRQIAARIVRRAALERRDDHSLIGDLLASVGCRLPSGGAR